MNNMLHFLTHNTLIAATIITTIIGLGGYFYTSVKTEGKGFWKRWITLTRPGIRFLSLVVIPGIVAEML